MNPDSIDKLYKEKFGENILYLNTKSKSANSIESLDENIESETIEKDGYKIEKPKRKISFLDRQCKYCKLIPFKKEDKESYIKYNCCQKCYILHEDDR